MDFAKRAVDHLHFDVDPIVRNRLDVDFYKLTMKKVILDHHAGTQVKFSMNNRTKDVRLAEIIPIEAMRAQLDYAQSLRYTQSDLFWIRGNTFYGEENIFPPSMINALRLSRLPDYDLSINDETGQFDLETEGNWADVMDWETIKCCITNEMRNRILMAQLSPVQLDIMYARAKTKFYAKLEAIRQHPELKIAEMGTRRRHSHPWQRWVIETMMEVLGDQFVGTSNSYFAKELGIPAIGTNAHEMPMVYAALAAAQKPGDEEALRQSQYQVQADWQKSHGDKMTVFLPDTFGTTQFLENAPDRLMWWNGARPDSKEAFEAGEELISWWKSKGQNPQRKTIVFSDGLDVPVPGYKINGTNMMEIHDAFHGRVNDTYGWGTMATNDFIGCVPDEPGYMDPISIVCKAVSANGHPTVKLSDNPAKASSPSSEEIELYKRTFGVEGINNERITLV